MNRHRVYEVLQLGAIPVVFESKVGGSNQLVPLSHKGLGGYTWSIIAGNAQFSLTLRGAGAGPTVQTVSHPTSWQCA